MPPIPENFQLFANGLVFLVEAAGPNLANEIGGTLCELLDKAFGRGPVRERERREKN